MKNNCANAILHEMQKSHGVGFADGYGQIPLSFCEKYCSLLSKEGDEFIIAVDEKHLNQKVVLVYFSSIQNTSESLLVGVIYLGDNNDPLAFLKSAIPLFAKIIEE